MNNSDVKLMDILAAIVIERGGEVVVSRIALEGIFNKYELTMDGNGKTFRIFAKKVALFKCKCDHFNNAHSAAGCTVVVIDEPCPCLGFEKSVSSDKG